MMDIRSSGNRARCQRWRMKQKVLVPDYFKTKKKESRLKYGGAKHYSNELLSDTVREPKEGEYLLQASHLILPHPTTLVITGPSQSGKTVLATRLIRFRNQMFTENIEELRWYYGRGQKFHRKLQEEFPEMMFIQGEPDPDDWDENVKRLIIIDDLMDRMGKTISSIFTKDSHHTNTSAIYITQNLFSPQRGTRTSNINSHFLIVMKSPKDTLTVNNIQKQMFTGIAPGFLQSVYRHATAKPHSYISISGDQYTDNNLRVRTQIFPDEDNYIYTPKN